MLIFSVDFQMTKMPAGWGRKEERKGNKSGEVWSYMVLGGERGRVLTAFY